MYSLNSCDVDDQWASTREGRQYAPNTTTSAITSRLRAKKIWNGYLQGQVFSVGKAALWWSTIGLLCISIINNDLALGVMRLAFNLALLIASPLAVQGAESIPIYKLLVNTTLLRLLTWAVAIPLIYASCVGETNIWPSWATLGLIMFADGVGAAYANSVDIDCGGLDILASEYDLQLTDFMRYKYTNTQQILFDSSFLLFVTPLMLIMDYLITHYSENILYYVPHPVLRREDLIFGLTCVSLFTILSICSLQSYMRCLPKKENENDEGRSSWTLTYETKVREMVDGLIIVLDNSGLKWRLIFLAAETALEDSMVSVIIPLLCYYLCPTIFGRESILLTAGASCFAIGVGKIGGLVASRWIADLPVEEMSDLSRGMISENFGRRSDQLSSSRLFRSVLYSAVALCLLPVGFLICEISETQYWRVGGGVCCLVSIFLFFDYSAAPKIGFSSLIQDTLNYDDFATPAVFGFLGVLVTVTDGILIFLLNVLFHYSKILNLTRYLLVALAATYLLLAILEYKYGASLIRVTSRSTAAPATTSP